MYRETYMDILIDLLEFLLDLIQSLLEPRKTLLEPKALATCCEFLIEFVLDLIKNLPGLAEFRLGLTIHSKSRS
jgi:hypothetical protein